MIGGLIGGMFGLSFINDSRYINELDQNQRIFSESDNFGNALFDSINLS